MADYNNRYHVFKRVEYIDRTRTFRKARPCTGYPLLQELHTLGRRQQQLVEGGFDTDSQSRYYRDLQPPGLLL